jgi:hypothetical protein
VTSKRAERRKLRDDTLAKLYKDKPEVRDEIAKAEGYAVFDGRQLNLVLYVGASGQGMLVDNKSGAETFMLMKRAGTGPGAGYKDYRQIMVFKSRALFDQFRTVGADVSASGGRDREDGEQQGPVVRRQRLVQSAALRVHDHRSRAPAAGQLGRSRVLPGLGPQLSA